MRIFLPLEACFWIACKNSFFRADTDVMIDLCQFGCGFSKKKLKTFGSLCKKLYLCTRFRPNGRNASDT